MRTCLIILTILLAVGCSNEKLALPEKALHESSPIQAEPENWQDLLPQQIEQVKQAVSTYKDVAKAKKDGWKKSIGADAPLMGHHYQQKEIQIYLSGDNIDFSKPSNLMYTEINGELVFTGVAFIVRVGADETVPAGFAGPEDIWHVHNLLDTLNAATEDRPFLRGVAKRRIEKKYLEKGDDRLRLTMVHVWTEIENPDGIFAHYNRSLAYLKLNLPLEWAEDASLESAMGLVMASEDGCEQIITGKAWLAGISRKQKKQLNERCENLGEKLRNSLSRVDKNKTDINNEAERAWKDFLAFKKQVYTPEQMRREQSLMEHSMKGHHH